MQSYKGQPTLTWWQGKVGPGIGYGVDQMANSQYNTTKTIRAGHGLQADLHELVITSAGTALITAYQTTTTNLSPLGGPRKGPVYACHAQEIDLVSGKVLFDWNSLSHVALNESYLGLPSGKAKGTPVDYFHINSVQELQNGNLLICARNTWALYEVDRSTGKILWRLNGKRSDFTMGAGSHFYWQHHAVPYANGLFTVFDDGSSPPRREAVSRPAAFCRRQGQARQPEAGLPQPGRLRGHEPGQRAAVGGRASLHRLGEPALLFRVRSRRHSINGRAAPAQCPVVPGVHV